MSQMVGLITNAYKRRAALLFFSVVISIFGLVTTIKFQNIAVPSLTVLIDTMQNDGKNMVLTFGLNLFSAFFLMMVSILWFYSAFKTNEDTYGYRYQYDDISTTFINAAIYVVTGVALLSFSLVFAFYIFNKILVVLIVGLIGAGVLYSSANNNNKK